MGWNIHGNRVTCDDGLAVSFNYPVRELIECGGVAVLVLNVPASAVMNENAFGGVSSLQNYLAN
jgi:hypothetical protein